MPVTVAQMQAMVAELREKYPDIDIELRPSLVTLPGRTGRQHHVHVRATVDLPLYVSSRYRSGYDLLHHLVSEEIDTFNESVSATARERYRHARFDRRANHYASWELFHNPIGPFEPVDTDRSPTWDSYRAAQAAAAGTGVTAAYVFPFTQPSARRAPNAEAQAREAVPPSLWDHLEKEWG